MSSRFQRVLAASVVGLSLSVFALAHAQQDDLDPLADLLQQTAPEDEEQAIEDGLATNDNDLRSRGFTPSDTEGTASDTDIGSEEEAEAVFPRLAPVFAPDYDPEDYIIRPESDEDDAVDDFNLMEEDSSPEGEGGAELPDDDIAADEPAELDFEYMDQPAVVIRGLDKITGRSTDMEIAVGSNAMLGGLRVTVRACHQTPPTEPPESIAYVEVEDYGFVIEDPESLTEDVDLEKRVFNGWMFASSPGLNGLEHAIYDVWVIRCMDEAPVLSETDSES